MPYRIIRCSRNSVRSILKRIQMRRSQATEGELLSSELGTFSGAATSALLSCHTLSYHILLYFSVVRCYILLCDSVPYPAIPRSILISVLRGALSSSSMSCHAMPCHAMPCHAMPCYAITVILTHGSYGDTDCWRLFCVSRRTSRIQSWACPSALSKLRSVSALHTTTALHSSTVHNTIPYYAIPHCTVLFPSGSFFIQDKAALLCTSYSHTQSTAMLTGRRGGQQYDE